MRKTEYKSRATQVIFAVLLRQTGEQPRRMLLPANKTKRPASLRQHRDGPTIHWEEMVLYEEYNRA